MTVGERIRNARKKQHLTQAALAERMNVSGAMIAQYEKGTRNPKYETILKFAEALEIQAADLLVPDDMPLSEDDRAAVGRAAKAVGKWNPQDTVRSTEDVLLTLGDEVFSEDSVNLHSVLSALNRRGMLALIEYAKVLSTTPGYTADEGGQYLTPEKPEGGT